MHPRKPVTETLNYFQQSPVRGQLEPTDGGSKSGWRYLQCTDTPNELRVLLPPRTALIYSYLLKAEASELNKDQTAAWDKIMQIRHLKDRMIRKCQRLARATTPKDKNTGQVALFTLHAPPDFRLKEMERWFRNQGSEFLQLVSGGSATTYCCSKCGPLGIPNTSSRHATVPSTRTATATRTPIPRASAPSTRAPTPPRDRNRAGHRPPTASATPSTTERTRTSSTSSKQARIPERVPKRPSDSSSKTVDPDPEPRYVIIRADLTTPSEVTLSRSSSARSNPPAPAAHATPAATRSQVPAVIRQPDTPPTTSPPRSVEQLRTPRSRSRSRSRSPLHAVLEQHPPRASVQSPEPLPIPYRPARDSAPRGGDLEDVEEPVMTGSPQPMAREEELSAEELSEPRQYDQDHFERLQQPMEELRALSPDGTLVSSTQNDPVPFATTGQPLETIHERPESELSVPPQRPLIRRRSSLKKRDSMSRLSVASQSKSVTWAMDRDWTEQMSKFVKTTNEAEVTAYELGELRSHYHEEIAMMRIICHDVVVAAEQLGISTDMLKREQQALSEQENKVVAMTDHMERKEASYRERVLAVLEETKRVVSLCDKKRDQHE